VASRDLNGGGRFGPGPTLWSAMLARLAYPPWRTRKPRAEYGNGGAADPMHEQAAEACAQVSRLIKFPAYVLARRPPAASTDLHHIAAGRRRRANKSRRLSYARGDGNRRVSVHVTDIDVILVMFG
jgi:hypothetical protein